MTEYAHYRGGRYTFICDAVMELDNSAVVVYRSQATGQTFVRPYEDFHGSVLLPDKGQRVERFTEIESSAKTTTVLGDK